MHLVASEDGRPAGLSLSLYDASVMLLENCLAVHPDVLRHYFASHKS